MSARENATPSPNGVTGAPNGHRVASPKVTSTPYVLDITKLHSLPSEQQEIFLLTFVSDLLQHVESLEAETLIAEQKNIKKELVKVLGLASPSPNRVVRNTVGCTFAQLFTRGTRSLLYETINEQLSILNAGKNEQDLKTKYAAATCLGHVFAAAGDSAIALSSQTIASLLKLLKSAQNHSGLRGALYKAGGRVAAAVGPSLDEQTARDLWKQSRNAASGDKSFLVSRHAMWCVEQLIKYTAYFDNTNDFDNLKSTLWKCIESPAAVVRHSAASCLAIALVKGYSEDGQKDAPIRVRKPKKSSKKAPGGEADEEAIERPDSPALKRPATVLSFSLLDALRVLSFQYTKTTNIKGKAAIAVAYRQFMIRLPERVVEDEYSAVAEHLFNDILSSPSLSYNRHRLLLSRRFVKIILQDTIGSTILGENAKLNAARWLINDILKNYPRVVQERREPTKHALTAALDALSGLIRELGSASIAVVDSCRDALFQVIQHPSYTVQIHAAHCFKTFVLACPQQLIPCAEICMKNLRQELDSLKSPRLSPRRCVSYSNTLAAMLSTSRSQPLYGSLDLFSRTLNLANELLKASSDSELRLSAAQIQVAWILIGGLMPLGPSFVKIHLSQLLLLWRNALPKPLTRENIAQRGLLETSFLAHVRECALGSLLVFLEYNSSLVTVDGSKRIAIMLQNTILFLESLPPPRISEELSGRLIPSLQMRDFASMVRRRVFQCYTKMTALSNASHVDAVAQSNVLNLAISSFTDPEVDVPKSLESSMASSASNFDGLCEMGDNSGSGVTSLLRGYTFRPLLQDPNSTSQFQGKSHSVLDLEIEDLLRTPSCSAKEYDSVLLYSSQEDAGSSVKVDAVSPATEVVNSAITLFALALPLQPPRIQEGSLEQLATQLQTSTRHREPARKAAVALNVGSALLYSLVSAVKDLSTTSGNYSSQSNDKLVQEILRAFVVDPDPYLRNLASQGLGRLSSASGSNFTTTEVNFLIDAIVSNRNPEARAGCAMALGSIHAQVGGMAAGLHLKNMVGILLSLCADPHPIVHFWAIEALRQVADTAGLTFSGYVTSTLGMVAQLYASDAHSEEAESLTSSNLEVEYSSTATLSTMVASLINVLGPDLQDMAKPRSLILTMMNLIRHEEEVFFQIQSMLCSRHLLLYSPSYVDFDNYVSIIRAGLRSRIPQLRRTAVENLNDITKRDAERVIQSGGAGFGDEIWVALDTTPADTNLQQIVLNWLQQTAIKDASAWVRRCQEILSKTKLKIEPVTAPVPQTATTDNAIETLDEEVAGFAAAAAAAQGESPEKVVEGQEFLKWQTRKFAMSCLSELLTLVSAEIQPDHSIPAEAAVQEKVGDVVRMAFSASTANVVELRILGLRIINQVLQLFGRTPDPDFLEASLLEQYQAQIASALTPAFAADSSPELASEAIKVCATFVAAGIVTHVDRMGRIFKLLVTGLENISDTAQAGTVGDLVGLSSNARVMLRMALLSAWAQLQVSSAEQQYLEAIVQPYTARLTPLWLSSLQEYARLRFEPEISSTLGTDSFSKNLDDLYAALNRQTLLGYYEDVWLYLINAIASLVDKDSEAVFDALDGKAVHEEQTNGVVLSGKEMRYRDEPVAFFFILYGLAFEALVRQARATSAQTLDILTVLKKLLRPAVSGTSVYQDTVFNESMDTLDRLALTGAATTQTIIVDVVRNLSLDHISAKPGEDRDDKLSDDIDQLFELTRIMILVLTGMIPTLEDPPNGLGRQLSDESVALIRLALDSLVDVADIFPSIIRADLHACIIHTFCTILSTGACQSTVVPQAFPIFKRFIEALVESSKGPSRSDMTSRLIRGCLRQFLMILARAQRRDSEFSLACAKNTLLALTILLTSASKEIPATDPLVAKALSEIRDCLQDLGLAKVAANCIRSLLFANPKSPTDEAMSRSLYPHLLNFVIAFDTDDPENARSLISAALTSSVSTLPHNGKLAAMSMIVPALLQRAKDEGSASHSEVGQRLLELVATEQMAFRVCLAGLDEEGQVMVQDILRSSGTGLLMRERAGGAAGSSGLAGGDDGLDGKVAPSIALRMDF